MSLAGDGYALMHSLGYLPVGTTTLWHPSTPTRSWLRSTSRSSEPCRSITQLMASATPTSPQGPFLRQRTVQYHHTVCLFRQSNAILHKNSLQLPNLGSPLHRMLGSRTRRASRRGPPPCPSQISPLLANRQSPVVHRSFEFAGRNSIVYSIVNLVWECQSQ